MESIDEKGHVFLDFLNRPYLCAKWTDGMSWLFYWHADHHWVSLRSVNQMEIWEMPNNLSQEHQDVYHEQHAKWKNAQFKIPDSVIKNFEKF